ncbi:hypothetical protein PF007_g30405, partial [Phytophthora fragariae]
DTVGNPRRQKRSAAEKRFARHNSARPARTEDTVGNPRRQESLGNWGGI